MNATELMIGNWVICMGRNEQVVDIMCDSISTMNNNCIPYDLVTPIPLTPEILVKCGFVKSGEIHYSMEFKENINGMASVDVCFSERDGILFQQTVDDGWHMGVDVKIQYLHQLQNIYLSLTGSPLNIEL